MCSVKNEDGINTACRCQMFPQKRQTLLILMDKGGMNLPSPFFLSYGMFTDTLRRAIKKSD